MVRKAMVGDPFNGVTLTTRVRRGIFAQLLRYVPSVVYFVLLPDQEKTIWNENGIRLPGYDLQLGHPVYKRGSQIKVDVPRYILPRGQAINGYLHALKGARVKERKRYGEFNRAIPIW